MKTASRLRLSAEAAALLRLAAKASPEPLHLVGGAVRDALLGRPTADLDLATASPRPLAAALARDLKATLVVLDEENAVFRLVLGAAYKTVRQIDIAGIQGKDIQEDLARRDFTVNAIALPLTPDLSQTPPLEKLLDPRQGIPDIARKTIRAESEEPFKEDPLRLLRAFRIAAQLDFKIEPATLKLISRLKLRALQPAAERIQAELLALLSVPGCSAWIKLMDETRLLTALFADLEPARQCALVYYGPGGVLTHSLETVSRADFLLHHLGRVFPKLAGPIEEHLESRSKGGISYRAVLILAALLHDIAKPQTARRRGGRLRFFGHDSLGAKRAAAILKKLKFSREHTDAVAAVIESHLRPGNLASGGPVTDKAVYRFFRDLGEDAVSLLLVCWADHASYLPEERLLKLLKTAAADPADFSPQRKSLRLIPEDARKTLHHLQVIAHLLRRRFDEGSKPVPDRVIDGRDVMKTLRLEPGPKVGEWLERVREAQAEGKIRDRQEALRFLLARAKA